MEKFIGIDIGGTKTSIVIGNSTPIILEKTVFLTKPKCGWKDTVNYIKKNIYNLLKKANLSITEIKKIGISCGGPLDVKKGIILSPPNLPTWDNVPLKEIMEEEFNMPTILENDANAGALAEWKFGKGQGYRNLIFLTMGTGMGAGLILNGKLYSGTNGLAGEVGHIRLRDKGPLGYHKRGSFEGFCSGSGIQKLSKKYFGKYIPTDVLIKKALKRDKKALQVIKESGKYLGRGLSILIDILNPEIIIIGTLAIKLGDLILAPARQIVKKEALLPSCKVCKIVAAGLGDRLGDIAALTVAMQ